jgi:aldose 1-epimerase
MKENAQVSLHGGPTGFDSVVWTVLGGEEAPQLFSKIEIDRIRGLPAKTFAMFRLISPDGDQGYPGELLTEVLIALVPSTAGSASVAKLGHVVIVYRSKLEDQKKAVTPVNLTQVMSYDSIIHEHEHA